MESFLPLKPEPYKQVIWRSLALYRASFSKIAVFSLLLSIIVFIPRLMSDIIGQNIFFAVELFSWQRLWLVAMDLISLIFFIAILWHIHYVMRGKKEKAPFIEDMTVGVKKALTVFIAAIIQSAIVFVFCLVMYGCLIFFNYLNLLFVHSLIGIIITAIIFFGQFVLLLYISTLFIFFTPLIAIENSPLFLALEKSVVLVWNNWWRVFSTQITPWIFYILVLIMLKYAFKIDVHIYFTQKAYDYIGTTLLHIVVFTIFIPWVAALLLVQLKDLELRKKLGKKHK